MRQPNLLFVFPDQMRGQAMGFLKEEPVRTPNLDRFASEGLVLNNAAATYPLCSPYRAMLMTGKYPHSNKVVCNCTSKSAPYGVELQEHDLCWSDILRANGYSMGYIGKWHLDAPQAPYIDCSNNKGDTKWNEWCPPQRRHGFDFWYSYGTYDQHTRPMYWSTQAERDGFHYVDQWGPEHEADLAVQYLRNEDNNYRDPNKPFALVVSMNPPHTPYELVPDKYVDMYSDVTTEDLCQRPNIPPAGEQWGDYYREHIRNYYAMITGIDDQFGRMLQALDDEGLANNTIVVFTSDHGNCLGIHNMNAKNNHYEESMRIPFIIRWPDRITPGIRDDLLLAAPDVYPTLIDLVGFGEDIPEAVEGSSYAGIFLGKDMERPTSQLYIWVDPQRPAEGRRGVRTKHHTFMVDRQDEEDRVVLHNNKKDPYQLRNIAADNQELVASLSKELDMWLQKTNDPWIRAKM